MVSGLSGVFLSLKWKLFLLLAVAFFFIALGVSWAAYVQQERQLQHERQLHQQRNSQELNSKIREVQDSLIRQAEYLVLLAEENRNILSVEQLIEGIEKSASRLMLMSGIEQLQVYSPTIGRVFQTGTQSDLLLDGVGRTAMMTEQPVVQLSCDVECRILAAVPVLLEGNTGSIAVASSIADIVLKVRQASGWDIGILMQTTDTRLKDLAEWGVHIAALSNRAQVEPVLRLFSNKLTFTGAGQYLFEDENRKYELAILPMPLLDQRQGYWMLLADVTESYQHIRSNNIWLLTVTWLSLLICALLLAVAMQPSLNGLSLIARTLPLLARHDYDSVRKQLNIKGGIFQQFFKDELSMLAASACNLSDELQRLDDEVRNRTLRLHKSSRELARQQDFVSGLLDNAQAVILLQDNNGHCRSINKFGRLLLGRSEVQCINQDFASLFGNPGSSMQDQLDQVYSGIRNVCRHEMQMVSVDGNQRSLSWLHSRLSQQDHNDAVLSIGMDITEQKVVQGQLQWLAEHDPLTELPNRAALQRRLQSGIEHLNEKNEVLAVIFCDLDHFKNINDSLGHPAGDQVLKQVAARMKLMLSQEDSVARWGGDEFVILVKSAPDIQGVEALAARLQMQLAQAYEVEGKDVFVTVSLGIAVCPEHGCDGTTLIKHADVAKYKAKEDGRKQYAVYSPEQSAIYEERLNLDMDLRYAIERDELALHYQPQLLADGETIVGVEALLRWLHPTQGMISPDRFIPLAEESGQIIEIGEWVLKRACLQLQEWRGLGMTDLTMSVNLAGPQIMEPQLIDRITRILDDTRVPASRLELEITESFVMVRPESAIARLQLLKALGISLAIDDFGTGYSSLSYLKKLPVDKLKIDKSFVFDIGRHVDDEAIAKAIIAMGHSMNLTVIAEGVENEGHVRFLKNNGCDELQGFFFSRPLPVQECTRFLKRRLPHQLIKDSG